MNTLHVHLTSNQKGNIEISYVQNKRSIKSVFYKNAKKNITLKDIPQLSTTSINPHTYILLTLEFNMNISMYHVFMYHETFRVKLKLAVALYYNNVGKSYQNIYSNFPMYIVFFFALR